MEIKNLNDLKRALNMIPDEALEGFGVGVCEEEFVELLCWDDEEQDTGYSSKYAEIAKKHPIIDDISKWINNIAKVQDQLTQWEEYETDDAISSEDKIVIKAKVQ